MLRVRGQLPLPRVHLLQKYTQLRQLLLGSMCSLRAGPQTAGWPLCNGRAELHQVGRRQLVLGVRDWLHLHERPVPKVHQLVLSLERRGDLQRMRHRLHAAGQLLPEDPELHLVGRKWRVYQVFQRVKTARR